MKKVKVLHLVQDLEIGGLENVLAQIVKGLESKYALEVWCLVKGGIIADELKETGVTVRLLGLKSYHNPFSILKLANLLRKNGIEILHCHSYF